MQQIEKLLDEFDDEVWGGYSDDNLDPDENENEENECSYNTGTEQSSADDSDTELENSCSDISYHESDDDLPLTLRNKYFVGKDGTKWARRPPNQRVRTSRVNIVLEKPGVIGDAKNANSILDAWNLFFTYEIVENIVACTNIFIDVNIRSKFGRERDARYTTIPEMKALFGVLYIIGALKNGHRSTKDMWSSDGCNIDILKCAMSEKRFLFLLRCIRFDDIRGREERKKLDKMTHIRKVFDDFTINCKKSYSLSEYVTLDEKLQSFRGRCSFRQYMPNKPAKYGIKIFALCDSVNYYTSNLEVYVGIQPAGPYTIDNSAASITKRMVNIVYNSGRNVTMDNWFTSIPLADDLLKKKVTIIGTIRKNKREIPPSFASSKNRPVFSSFFGFSNNKTLVSYKANKKKIVMLISTIHHDKNIANEEKLKPEIIMAYNSTKSGVDTMDYMTENYTVARTSARWPLTIFYALMNIGGINSQIIYQANTKIKISRLQFLKTLGRELMEEHVQCRMTIPAVRVEVKSSIRKYFNIQPLQESRNEPAIDIDNPVPTSSCVRVGKDLSTVSEPSCSRSSNIANQATAVHEVTPILKSNPLKRSRQLAIPNYTPKKISVDGQKKLDTALIKLFIKDLQPFSVVEDTGFKEFVNMLNPSYKIPNRHTISKTLIPAAYEKCVNEVQSMILNELDKACLTTDCWTTRDNKSYIVITIHFINNNFNIKSILLSCHSFSENHTSENLSGQISKTLNLWDLKEKIVFAVSDNAYNKQNALGQLQFKHLSCFAHTLNLIVQSALKKENDLIDKVKTFVLIFHVERFVQLETSIRGTMGLLDNAPPCLNSDEWTAIKEFCSILRPFEEATRAVSGEQYITASLVIVIAQGLKNVCEQMKNENYSIRTLGLVNNILNDMKNCQNWGNIENSKTLRRCTFLDPRFKNLPFTHNENMLNSSVPDLHIMSPGAQRNISAPINYKKKSPEMSKITDYGRIQQLFRNIIGKQ
ncbi:hypothetical protein QTP88_000613 [Uroleucon formosanum]